jgi:UPF0716 protein FxsA
MAFALLLLILWPIAEVWVAIKVAGAIGVLPMILLLVVSWPLGSWVLRSRGRAAWRRFALAVSEGRPPGRAVADGALLLLGGLLLIVPGFISDAFGLALLLPPTRLPLRSLVLRNFQSRFVLRAARFSRPASYDVDGTASDIDQPRLHP